MDKSLSPEERVEKAWFTKSILVFWREATRKMNPKPCQKFLTPQTYKDLICAIDGLVLFLILMKTKYPEDEIKVFLVTSDHNELFFAFVRTGRNEGRKTNLDAYQICHGTDGRNRTTEVADQNIDITTNIECAHTRGRTVCRDKTTEKIYLGKDISLLRMKEFMQRGTKRAKILLSKIDAVPSVAYRKNVFSDDESEDSDDGDNDNQRIELDDFVESDNEEEAEDDDMHPDKAVTLYCNGDRSTIPSMARRSRFYYNLMDKTISMSAIPGCCDDDESFISLGEKGTFSTIRTAKDTKLPTKVTGTLKSMTVLGQAQIAATPVGIACTVHSNLAFWVLANDRKLYLCNSLLRKAAVGVN